MEGHIQKWGNSLGLRIPAHLAKLLQLHSGSAVTIEIEDNKITIQPSKYNLEKMLKKISKKNLHGIAFEGKSLGNEEW